MTSHIAHADQERCTLWDLCERHFRAALEYENRPISLEMVRESYFAGGFDIIRGIGSALLVEVVTIDGYRHLHAYLGGGDLTELIEVLCPRAEILGAEVNCQSVLIDGRKGWARALRHRGYFVITKNDGWWVVAKKLAPRTFEKRVKPLTAINYTVTPNYVAVATDTLTTDLGDWLPKSFTPKAAFIPHLDALLTSTTYMTLLRDCFNYALQAPVRDLDELAPQLAGICRQTFSETQEYCQALHPPGEDFSWTDTCALSLFGWSAQRGRLVGFRFALKDDFEPELLADGVYTQPRIENGPHIIGPANVLDLCKITRQQQESEMRLTPADRNAIGGDILLWELQADSDGHVTSRVQRALRFETYRTDLEDIKTRTAAAP